jgi:hypothetical protein
LTAELEIFEVTLSFFVFISRVDTNVGLVVDFPAPSIVVERTNRHNAFIEDVCLSV